MSQFYFKEFALVLYIHTYKHVPHTFFLTYTCVIPRVFEKKNTHKR